jgi:alkyldihydroxyacetonephosphate synthase
MMQARLPLSMLRLSTAMETETTLALAGHVKLIRYLKEMLSWRGIGDERSLLILGVTESRASVRFGRSQALAIAREYGGVDTGTTFGKEWRKNRFRSPYLRNTLWEAGYALDTLETATRWRDISPTIVAIESALRPGLEDVGERVLCFTHISHTYPWGSNIYTTYLYRIPAHGSAEEAHRRWQVLKQAASHAIVRAGGTITHQHGIGLDHQPYLPGEKGPLGMTSLSEQMHVFDPQGLMNPGKLLGASRSATAETNNVAN